LIVMKTTLSALVFLICLQINTYMHDDWRNGPLISAATSEAATGGKPIPFPSSSGVLDATFGSGGLVTTAVGIGNDVAQAAAIQADGKIVAAGYAFNGSNNDFAVVRYNPNGTLDSTFGMSGNGIVLTPVGTSEDEAFGVALQSDGKIVLVGQSSNGINTDIAVVRYNLDGTLDTTFNDDGRAAVSVGNGNDLGRSVAIQLDGKIVVTGNSLNVGNFDIAVIRLETDGSLDLSFDGNSGVGNGVITTQVATGNDQAYAVAVQPDAKIVVAGYYAGASGTDTVILRYGSDGILDTTFDADGIAVHALSPGDTDEALAMALQSDGRIVIAGCVRNGGANDFLMARFEQNGTADSTFGTNGSTIIPFSVLADIGLSVAVQDDGKIVAAGFASNGSNNDFGVTRVNANGTLDSSFDEDGRQQTMIGMSADSANAVAIQADGKIVVVGRTVIGATADFALTRYGYGSNVEGNDGFIDLSPTTAIRFDNAFRSGTSSVMHLDAASLQPLPAGWTFVGEPRNIETTALFSGDVLIRLTMLPTIDAASFETIRILQYENNGWTDRTAASPPRDFSAKTIYARVSSLAVIAAASPGTLVAPTASVSGRVTTPGGQSLRNTFVSLIDSNNERRSTSTSSFGIYVFADVPTGRFYTITGASKRYRFAPKMVSVRDNLSDVDLVGLE
jgi:uncharacterized delta-60 repeat protein